MLALRNQFCAQIDFGAVSKSKQDESPGAREDLGGLQEPARRQGFGIAFEGLALRADNPSDAAAIRAIAS